jgi:hypothetical protein
MDIEFGAYIGQDLGEIPSDYLYWLIETLEDDDRFNRQYPDLYEEVEEELATRDRSHAHFYKRDL